MVEKSKKKNCVQSFQASEDCPRWIVVLPPWCFLAHWRVDPGTRRGWETFFDLEQLNSGSVKSIEFSEFRSRHGNRPHTRTIQLVLGRRIYFLHSDDGKQMST